MNFDDAVRTTEILLGFAFFQQSAEHLVGPKDEQRLFFPRALLSLLLLFGIYPQWVCLALVLLGLGMLKRFAGPYNGGCDRMSLLILCCLCLSYFLPTAHGKEAVFGYAAVQLVLSYWSAGWVKFINPEWRHGRALRDVFLFSAYPVSEAMRGWANKPRLLWAMSWGVMLFELFFPFALITQTTLVIALVLAACFHVTNAFLFGLNRFFWIWLAAYPSILWLQQRLFV